MVLAVDDNKPVATKQFGLPLQVKHVAAREAGTFSGWGSTFGGPADAYNDEIQLGAFAKSIAAHRAAKTAPALLWSHTMSEPIGVVTQLVEDSYGLRVDGKLTLQVSRAAEAHALMRAGALGLSIGYSAINSTRKPGGIRLLTEIKLHEISCVSIPANSNSKIISVKTQPTIAELQDLRVAERILRDGGYSHKQATAIVSRGRAAFKQRDVAEADDRLAKKIMAAVFQLRK
jgi:uncharacterized protein